MQSKTSFFNRGILDKNLRRVAFLGFIYFIMMLIMVPVQYMIYLTPKGSWGDEYSNAYYLYECCSKRDDSIVVCVMVIITVLTVFSYLFNKRDAYMMHSFPVSRKAFYCTGIITCVLVTIVPLVFVAVITTIAAVTTGANEGVAAIWFWAFSHCAQTSIFLGIAALCVMFTGQVVTAAVFYAILNLVFLGMEFSIKLAQSVLNFGLSNGLNNIDFRPTTPAAYANSCGVSSEIQWDATYSKIEKLTVNFLGTKVLICYLILGVVFVVAAYFIYKRKPIETVHDFISFKPVKPVFTVGMSFFCSVVFGALTENFFDSTVIKSYGAASTVAIVCTIIMGQ